MTDESLMRFMHDELLFVCTERKTLSFWVCIEEALR